MFAELLDRLAGEMLRDEINKRSQFSMHRRGIIITDNAWYQESSLQSQPAISIGGPPTNKLTDQMASSGEVTVEEETLHTAVFRGDPLRIALWGYLAADCRSIIEKFIRTPDGLTRYLLNVWR